MTRTNLAHMPAPRVDRIGPRPAAIEKIEKLFYRRQEAAYALGLPLRSIDYMIADHRLHTRRYGRSVLIPASEIKLAAERILRDEMAEGNTPDRV